MAHISLADPFCPDLSAQLAEASERSGAVTHRGGTVVVIEGPAFSTRAESELYRSWGAHVIGMTALPEAKLAREAEICYASLCSVTDYDVWHEQQEDVSAELILANLQRNAERGRATVSATMTALDGERRCACGEALTTSLVTAPELAPAETRRRLAALLEPQRGTSP